MTVAIVVSRLGVGGAERQIVRLAMGLRGDGFQPLIVCLKDAGEVAPPAGSGIEVIALGYQNGRNPEVVRALAHVLSSRGADVAFCSNYNSTVWGRLAAILAGVPVIVTAEHSMARSRRLSGAVNLIVNRLMSHRTAAVVACADAQVPVLVSEGNRTGAIRVIHNGVDLEMYDGARSDARRSLGVPVDSLVVGIVASLGKVKDHAMFLQAAACTLARVPEAYFVIVGDGLLRGSLEESARCLGISRRVMFAGVREDLPRVLTAFDVACLTSRSEAFPMAVLEYMAAGLPVVATDVGGVGEAVVAGLTGELVQQGDADAFSAALVRLLESPGLRRSLGDAGRRRHAELFSEARMVNAFKRLLRELAEGRL